MVDFPAAYGPMCDWAVVELVPGALPLLKALNDHHYCHLATNAADSSPEQIRKALARVGASNSISEIFSFQTTGFRKPSPEFFQTVATQLEVPLAQLTIIGDNLDNDILSAQKLGLKAIWLNRENNPVPKGVEAVHCLTELLKTTA